MLRFVLVEESLNKALYHYSPEGSEDFGIVSFDSGKCSIELLAKSDCHERYALKMFTKMREMAKNGVFEKEGIIAWY